MPRDLLPYAADPAAALSQTSLSQTEKLELFQATAAHLSQADFAQKLATAALVPIVIAMIENSFARKTFQVDKIDMPVATYTVKRRMKPVIIQKYGATPEFTYEYPILYVRPDTISVKPRIHMQTLMDAQFDAAADILNDAGLEMAVKEDKMFLALLQTAAPTGTSTTTTVVPQVVPGPYGQGLVLNSNNYQVGTNDTTATATGGQAGEVAMRHFLAAKGKLAQIGYNADTVLMNPYDQGILSSQTAFAYYMNWGTREVAETGVITNPFGLKTVLSPLIPHGTIYIFDNRELARLVEREPVTVRPNQVDLFQEWLVWERIAPFIRNANAVINLSYYV